MTKSTRLEVVYSEEAGAMIRLSVFLVLILLFSLPASALPMYGAYNGNVERMSRGGNENAGLIYGAGIIWHQSERITWLGNATNPSVYENNGNYDVVWQDDRDGNWEIYYTKITAGGFKLVNDSRISYYGGEDINPQVVSKGDRVYVVWQRLVAGHWAIYFSSLLYSSENISIVVPPKSLVSDGNNATNPRLAMDSHGDLHIVWQEWKAGQWDVMYEKINGAGTRLIGPVDVSADLTNSTEPVLALDSSGNVNILWLDDNSTPGYSIFYRGLDEHGCFRTPVRRISVVSPDTEISVSYNNALSVVFTGSRENESYGLIYTSLNDTGATVLDDRNLTPINSLNASSPSVFSSRNRNFVVWAAGEHVEFSAYDMKGNRINGSFTIAQSKSFSPQIAVSNDFLGVVWVEHYGNKSELFFRAGEFPDVYVSSISVDAHGTGQNNTHVNAVVGGDAGIAISVEYALFVDGTLQAFGNVTINTTASLIYNISLSPGSHRILFSLDPDNFIYERDEQNNNLTKILFVRSYKFSVYATHDLYLTKGNATNVTVSITNTGNWVDNYTVAFDNVSKGIAVYPDSFMCELEPNMKKNFNFTVKAGSSVAPGTYTMNVVVRTDSNITENSTVNVHILPVVKFKIQYPQLVYVSPDKTHTVNVSITNLGDCNDSYTITSIMNTQWAILQSNKSLNLSAGTSATVSMSIMVPFARAFTKALLMLSVSSNASGTVENATIVLIVKVLHSAKVMISNASRSEGTYSFSIVVRNLGNLPDFYNFNLTGNMSSYALLSEYSALVPMNTSAVINLTVNVPAELVAGGYELSFRVICDNSTISTLPISITVPARYGFTAQVNQKNSNLELVIKNTGNAAESVAILPKLANKKNVTWVLQYMGRNYTNTTYVILQPNQTVKVLLWVKTNLDAGAYNVQIALSSSSGMEKNLTAKLVVGKENRGILSIIMDNLLYIIAGAVAAVVAVLIYLRHRE